jgi:chromosome segregation ATPase
MYEAQLNRHEEQISDINGRLHSYDLGLRWCEEQIKKLAGDDYSSGVVIDNTIEKEYDKLKNDHNCLKEAYKALDDRYNRERENFSEKYNELKDSIDSKNRMIASLEKGAKTQGNIIVQKTSEICALRSELEKYKEAYLRSQVDVDNFQRAYTEETEKVKTLNENIEHLERENEHLRELYSCTVESSKKIIDKLRKGKD